MGVSQDVDQKSGAVQTTNATVTDIIPAFAIADKTITVIRLRAWAVRSNTANPIVYYTERLYTLTLSGGVAANASSSPTVIAEHGDNTMEAAVVIVGGGPNVKVQVTGLGPTTFDWRARIDIDTVLSN